MRTGVHLKIMTPKQFIALGYKPVCNQIMSEEIYAYIIFVLISFIYIKVIRYRI